MDRTRRASKAVTDKLIKQVIGPPKEKNKEEGDLQAFQRQLSSVARDPQLNNYVLDKTFSKKSEGFSFNDLARSLLDAKDRATDKTYRSQLPGLLLRLMYYEEIPSDVVARLVPLFRAYSNDVRVVRLLFYICTAHASSGCAGTPTLLGAEGGLASTVVIRPELNTLQTIFAEAQQAVQTTKDLAVRRASLYLMAATARSHEAAKKEMLTSMERLVDAAENSSENWELQHSVFGTVRFSGSSGGSTAFGAAAFAGVGSPDPVGARHSLALVADVALKDPLLVVTELSSPLAKTMEGYDPYASTPPPLPINLQDPWARSHLARACAAVVHSDQGTCDVTRGGAPFWKALVTLATLDSSDMVRFAALKALTGVTPASTSMASSTREGMLVQQRRSRAWRALEAQAETLVLVPGAGARGNEPPESSNTMKLIEVVGRLLVLAFRKTEAAARFTVAVSVAGSLAESCMFSPTSGPAKESRVAVDRVMTVLARELSSLVESPLQPSQRGACIEALLYFQACGYETTLTPAKLMSMRGNGNAMLRCHASIQESLLSAILKCARARPKQTSMFLRYASGIVAIAPASMNPNKAVDLWDALCANSPYYTATSTSTSAASPLVATLSVEEGKAAALSAALETLSSSSGSGPPQAQAQAQGTDILTAAREDAGWSAFVAIAAWWLGEHANDLCNEHVGRTSIAWTLPRGKQRQGKTVEGERTGNDNNTGDENGANDDDENGANDVDKEGRRTYLDPFYLEAAVRRQSSRNPALTRVISVLHEVVLTGPWTLRAAAARALGTIAVRSGEPFRMQCYVILNTCLMPGGGVQDALGLRAVVRPAIEALDAIYSTLQVLEDELYPKYGWNSREFKVGNLEKDGEGEGDETAWPPEVKESLTRRVAWLTSLVETTVCSVPPSKYSILGARAAKHLVGLESGILGGVGDGGGGLLEAHRLAADKLSSNVGGDRNKEVEDILSFGGTEPGFNVDKLFAGSSSDQQKSVEVEKAGASPYEQELVGAFDTFTATSNYDYNQEYGYGGKSAFEDDARDLTYDDEKGGELEQRRVEGWEEEEGGEGLREEQRYGDGTGGDGTGSTARTLGKGTMLHTFIADPSHPEELSIFEGDAVEVVEEADGWFLVSDPSGSRGLVPATYVRIDQLFANASTSNVNSQQNHSVWGIAEPAVSLDHQSSVGQAPPGEELGLQQGTVWADFPTPRTTSMTATSSPRRGGGATSPTKFSPGAVGNPFGDVKGHHRTLSGGSDAMSWGSIPTTPSQIDGPERSITAGFLAEMEGELSVEPGDVVKVHSEVGGWARVLRVSDRATGLVPSWAVGG